MATRNTTTAAAILACTLTGCQLTAGDGYILYRTSVVEDMGPFEVARFVADMPDSYNRENCEVARGLFRSQPSVEVNYYCHPVEADKLSAMVTTLLTTGTSSTETSKYRLYSEWVSDPGKREYVATFDADQGGDFDKANCEVSRLLLEQELKRDYNCVREGK